MAYLRYVARRCSWVSFEGGGGIFLVYACLSTAKIRTQAFTYSTQSACFLFTEDGMTMKVLMAGRENPMKGRDYVKTCL
jgi:hypothetical protein